MKDGDKFTEQARKVLSFAEEEAQRFLLEDRSLCRTALPQGPIHLTLDQWVGSGKVEVTRGIARFFTIRSTTSQRTSVGVDLASALWKMTDAFTEPDGWRGYNGWVTSARRFER